MDTTTERRIVRHRVEDLTRLADQGERKGVRILLSPAGQHIATSASDPTRCYRVDLNGCECKGFAFWGRCQHHSLFLAELGRLDPEPTPPAAALTVQCESCSGRGYRRWSIGGGLSDWEVAPCRACGSTGELRVAA
ncbi:MAG TPA: hypothetical protein VGR16_05290 [Thermomicrobiales bacterium]|nr:hypothetical protein [Thermomicrobiales bacterium]